MYGQSAYPLHLVIDAAAAAVVVVVGDDDDVEALTIPMVGRDLVDVMSSVLE